MAVLPLLEDIANGRIRRERVFCDNCDFLAYGERFWIRRGNPACLFLLYA